MPRHALETSVVSQLGFLSRVATFLPDLGTSEIFAGVQSLTSACPVNQTGGRDQVGGNQATKQAHARARIHFTSVPRGPSFANHVVYSLISNSPHRLFTSI
jgi:hypothetical protein